jgi:hypothetical protein
MKKLPKKRELTKAVKAQPKRKDFTPTAKTQPKRKELTTAVKQLPKKRELATAVKAQPKRKELTPVVKTQLKRKELTAAVTMQSQKRDISPEDLGKRYKCYKCGTKFFDLGRPQPLCPLCGEDQNNEETKRMLKRKKKRRSAYVGKTDHNISVPEERDDLIEVVKEVENDYVLDMDDIVLEEYADIEKN